MCHVRKFLTCDTCHVRKCNILLLFIFLLFFFKKNINNIFKLYIINRKLELRFIYYFMSGNPSNDGRSDKPRSRSPHTRVIPFFMPLSGSQVIPFFMHVTLYIFVLFFLVPNLAACFLFWLCPLRSNKFLLLILKKKGS
jgi:hypothetical protein